MKTTYALILIFFFKIIVGQNDATKIYKNQIKLSPTRLVNVVRGIEVSYERKFSDKLSTQLTANYIIDLLPHNYSDQIHMTGFSFGIEQKYFWKKTKCTAYYLSADFTFLNTSFDFVHDFTYKPNGDSSKIWYSDTIGINRKTYTFSLKQGFQFYLKHFVFDINLGIGLRYRDVRHSNKLYQDGIWVSRREPNVIDELFNSGQYFTFNIPFGLKIGYQF